MPDGNQIFVKSSGDTPDILLIDINYTAFIQQIPLKFIMEANILLLIKRTSI